MWIYRKTEDRLWTVGYFEPNGKFYGAKDFTDEYEAAEHTHYLNGGREPIKPANGDDPRSEYLKGFDYALKTVEGIFKDARARKA